MINRTIIISVWKSHGGMVAMRCVMFSLRTGISTGVTVSTSKRKKGEPVKNMFLDRSEVLFLAHLMCCVV